MRKISKKETDAKSRHFLQKRFFSQNLTFLSLISFSVSKTNIFGKEKNFKNKTFQSLQQILPTFYPLEI